MPELKEEILSAAEESNGMSAEDKLEIAILKIEASAAVSAESLKRLADAKPEMRNSIEDALEAFKVARAKIQAIREEEGLRPGSRVRVIEAIRQEAEQAAKELLEGPGSQ